MKELTSTEKAHRKEVSFDMDLMNMARDKYGFSASDPESDVLDAIHADYPGGISQYWLNERF